MARAVRLGLLKAAMTIALLMVGGAVGPSLAQEDGWSVRGLLDDLLGSDADQGAAPQEEGSVGADAPVPLPVVPPGDSLTAAEGRVPQDRAEIELTFAPLVQETAPAVVNVYAARTVAAERSPFAGDPFFGQFFGRRFDPRPRMQSSLGSGVIVDPSGLVVTNNHVVENADQIRIAFADGREFETRLVQRDDRIDLAILQIEGGEGPFQALEIGDSDDLQIGDLVLAIGNPFGIGQTVTNGIVSALARSHIGIEDFGFFIQTDAAINPGNSGGALVSMDGKLAGINTAIFSRSGGSNGIGFAIPSNMVARFVEAAREGEPFRRPYVGASFAPVTADIAEAMGLDRPTGALVAAVTPDGPAAAAGIKVGDLILSLNSFRVDNPEALGYRLATTTLGDSVPVEIQRGGEPLTLNLTPIAAPEKPPRDARVLNGRHPFAGAEVVNLSPRVAEDLDLPLDRRGVVVIDVRPGSFARRFGLRPGDIVLTLNGQEVESTASLEEALSQRVPGWRFEVERDGRVLTQTVR